MPSYHIAVSIPKYSAERLLIPADDKIIQRATSVVITDRHPTLYHRSIRATRHVRHYLFTATISPNGAPGDRLSRGLITADERESLAEDAGLLRYCLAPAELTGIAYDLEELLALRRVPRRENPFTPIGVWEYLPPKTLYDLRVRARWAVPRPPREHLEFPNLVLSLFAHTHRRREEVVDVLIYYRAPHLSSAIQRTG